MTNLPNLLLRKSSSFVYVYHWVFRTRSHVLARSIYILIDTSCVYHTGKMLYTHQAVKPFVNDDALLAPRLPSEIQNHAAVRIEFKRISLKSPPASHIANPLSPFSEMNLPFAANDWALSKDTMIWLVKL